MEEKKIQVIGSPEKSIPKYATNVNFSKLENGDVLMMFANKSNKDTPTVLIETIIVNGSHAKKIVEVLANVIKTKKDE